MVTGHSHSRSFCSTKPLMEPAVGSQLVSSGSNSTGGNDYSQGPASLLTDESTRWANLARALALAAGPCAMCLALRMVLRVKLLPRGRREGKAVATETRVAMVETRMVNLS